MLNHLCYDGGSGFIQIGKHSTLAVHITVTDFTLHKIYVFIGERLIILHAGYNKGVVPNPEVVLNAHSSSGDYHGEMNHKMIVRWLEDKLIPNLPPKCVFVMENAAYHIVQVDRRPLMTTKKHLIQEWLTRHGIQWSKDPPTGACLCVSPSH